MKIQFHVMALLMSGIAVGFVGCGSPEDEASGVDVGQENICEAVAEVMCHNMFECCTGKEREEKLGEELTITERECAQDMILECEKVGNDHLQAVTKSSFSFDLERANACVGGLMLPEDGSCFTNEVDPAVYALCFDSALGEGLVEDGGDCFWSWECAGSAYCDFAFTCVALPTDGEDCTTMVSAPSACAEGHFCIFPDTICHAYVGAGEDCVEIWGDPDYASCEPTTSFCSGDDDTTIPTTPGTCTSRFPLGSLCDDVGQCLTGECLFGSCEAGAAIPCLKGERDCAQGFCQGTEDLCSSDADCTSVPCEKNCLGAICYSPPEPLDYCHFGLEAPCYVFGDC